MDAARRKISLVMRSSGSTGRSPSAQALAATRVGDRAFGTVTRVMPERDGRTGYLLLRLPSQTRPAMLLAKEMSDDLCADLNNGHIELDEEVFVEVISVDKATGKVLLRELPEPEEEQAPGAGGIPEAA